MKRKIMIKKKPVKKALFLRIQESLMIEIKDEAKRNKITVNKMLEAILEQFFGK